jgi:hypothetical protein
MLLHVIVGFKKPLATRWRSTTGCFGLRFASRILEAFEVACHTLESFSSRLIDLDSENVKVYYYRLLNNCRAYINRFKGVGAATDFQTNLRQ